MTAFPGASIGSPEFANTKFADVDFLPANQHPVFEQLVLAVQSMMREGDDFIVPSALECGAWRKTFSLYRKLKDRADAEERRGVAEHKWFVDDQNAWQNYISDREQVLQMLQRGIFDSDTLTDHLDVQLPGDLASPTTAETDRYGSSRHPEWRERATRLSSALRWWDALGTEARMAIKQERALKKLQAFKQERAHG